MVVGGGIVDEVDCFGPTVSQKWVVSEVRGRRWNEATASGLLWKFVLNPRRILFRGTSHDDDLGILIITVNSACRAGVGKR